MSTISSVLPRWHNCWVRFTCGKSDVRIPSSTDRSQQSNAWQQVYNFYSNTVVSSYEKQQHSGVIPRSTCSRGRSAGGALTERWRSTDGALAIEAVVPADTDAVRGTSSTVWWTDRFCLRPVSSQNRIVWTCTKEADLYIQTDRQSDLTTQNSLYAVYSFGIPSDSVT